MIAERVKTTDSIIIIIIKLILKFNSLGQTVPAKPTGGAGAVANLNK